MKRRTGADGSSVSPRGFFSRKTKSRRVSFTAEAILENLSVAVTTIVKARPAAVKGVYLKGLSLASTMSPGIPLEVTGKER